ncbi:TMV resistance protein N-like, partial [Castanea sativa]|uniref:TMV resistance protein N-like n=1 Tax=Castanea sativa TaxID=21020 RepID=UPI003F64A536
FLCYVIGSRTTCKSECDFIQGIVKEISSAICNRRQLYDVEYLVGINSRVKEIKSLLNIKSNEVCFLGIHGLPGIGKTTIANVVYWIIAHQFGGSCFLEKVREKSINCGMIQLQKKLLSKILQDDSYLMVDSEFEGTNLIRERICCKKVLLVLDDVDNSEQIKKLLGTCDWFASGSVVIITTKDTHVLTALPKGRLIYKVKELGQCEARDLFNMHAFHPNEPKEDYSKLAELIISYAEGLPLALKVMGSDLCEKSICEWTSAFEMYKNIQHEKIQEILKISFIGLNKNEKDIFLDIACFFKGRNKDYVVKILDACDLYPVFGIKRLIDKCLITVEDGTLWMHDLLQQMGREIVLEESKRLENRSRIWCHEDANKLLTRNKGSDEIRGIMWCELNPKTVTLEAEAFKKMENLKFLIVKNVQNSKELKYLSNELRLFEWSGYNFSLPSEFCPPKLVGLEVSNIANLFEQGCHYKYLRNIQLERCQSITRVPDLCAPNLERLYIFNCENLIEIHDSIGLLDKLESWFLSHCKKLQILPSTLKLNKRFNLWNCPRLEKFPNVHPERKCLIDFTVYDCNIREWPLSLRYLTEGIIRLEIRECENLGKFLDSTNKLQLLEEIDTPILNSFRIFNHNPEELVCSGDILIDLDFWLKNDLFPALRYITIEDSNIVCIPESIFSLSSRLKGIYIHKCKELREIQNPRLPQSIREVQITRCPSLLPQSSSRLLNEFGKILGILPNRVSEGARSDILMDLFDDSESESESDSEIEDYNILLPGTEIPKSLKFNHQSFGNSISFKVGSRFHQWL